MKENNEFSPRKVVYVRERILFEVNPMHHQIISVVFTEAPDPAYIHLDSGDSPILGFRLRRSRSR